MNGCCFVDVQSVRMESLADPEIEAPGDAIVKVELAGLCGSDLHPYFGRETGLDPGTVMGHEFVGRVVEAGSNVNTVQVGDRVCCPFSTSCGSCFYCQKGLTSRCVQSQLFGWRQEGTGLHGGQSEFVSIPNANGSLVKLKDNVSNNLALLAGDNLATGFYCAEMASIDPDGVYLVIGCGTVGLLTILAARELGAEKIFAYDLLESRRQLAESLGARAMSSEDQVVSEIRSATDNRGADGVMELVGLLPAQSLAFRAIRPGGVISTIGCHCTPNFGFSPVDAYDKNITYRTGRCPARSYMDRLLNDSNRFEAVAEKLITHQFALADCTRAYDVFSQQKNGCLKAAISFS